MEVYYEKICSREGSKNRIFWWDGKDSIIQSRVYDLQHSEQMMQTTHYQLWEKFQQEGLVAMDSDHKDYPRGRVSWNMSLNQSVVCSGEYPSETFKKMITEKFHCVKPRYEYLEHYDMEILNDNIFSTET
ncbi:MAG: hypothetical protein FWG66_14125 [Spirochaetes bacterium]|nr:hypothetical protein [Spirochaetota bacterium]